MLQATALPSNAQAKIEDMSRYLFNHVSSSADNTLTAVTRKIAVRDVEREITRKLQWWFAACYRMLEGVMNV